MGLAAAATLTGAVAYKLSLAPPAKPASSGHVLLHGVEYNLEYDINDFKLPDSVLPHAVHVKGKTRDYDFTQYAPLLESYDVLLWDGDKPSTGHDFKTFADAIRLSLQQNVKQIGVAFRSSHYGDHTNEKYKLAMYERMALLGVEKNRIIIVWLRDATLATMPISSLPPMRGDPYILPNLKAGLLALRKSRVKYVICMNGGETAYWEAINMPKSVIWNIYHEQSKTGESPFWENTLDKNNLEWGSVRTLDNMPGNLTVCFALWKAPPAKPASSGHVLLHGVEYNLEYDIDDFKLHDSVLSHAVHVKGKVKGNSNVFKPYVPLLKSYDVLLWDGDKPSTGHDFKTFADAIRLSLQQNVKQIGVAFRSSHYRYHTNEQYKLEMYELMALPNVEKNRIIIVWLGDATLATMPILSLPPMRGDPYTVPNLRVGLFALRKSGVKYVICINGGETAYWEAINMPESVIWNIYHEQSKTGESPFWGKTLHMNNLKWGPVRTLDNMPDISIVCFALWKGNWRAVALKLMSLRVSQ